MTVEKVKEFKGLEGVLCSLSGWQAACQQCVLEVQAGQGWQGCRSTPGKGQHSCQEGVLEVQAGQ